MQLSNGDSPDFDLIIVANGHYRFPRYPNTPGLSKWIAAGKALHSAWYRHALNLGEIVVVVGDGPSGHDIAAEMRAVARTVIHSVNGGVHEDIGNLKMRGRIVEFKDEGQVVFDDGTTESHVDYCLLATGYELSFPFLPTDILQPSIPPSCPPLPPALYNSGYHIFPLAKHIFPLWSDYPPAALAFMGLLVKVAPFPLFEAQGRAIVKAFEHPVLLDTTQEATEIIIRYEELASVYGDDTLSISKNWHKLRGQAQFNYRNRLFAFSEGDTKMTVPDWEPEMYAKKDVLRRVWRELERTGKTDEWVKGVGEGGSMEWVDMTRRLLKTFEEGEE